MRRLMLSDVRNGQHMSHRAESPNLDFLRSIAVLAVLVDHLAATLGIAQRHGELFWALGRWGVLLFFIHTSLVLMMSMERLGLPNGKLYRTFLIRRVLRIFPLSIATVALVLVFRVPQAAWIRDAYHSPDLLTVISNLFLFQNIAGTHSLIGPLWSLPYEIQMYLVLPILFIALRRNPSAKLLIGISAVALILGQIQQWYAMFNPLSAERFGIAEFAPCFLCGVIAYCISRGRRRARLPVWMWPLTVLVMTGAYLRWTASVGYVGYVEWISCLAVGLLVSHCTEFRSTWFNLLTHNVAKYSYGLYLSQMPILWLVMVKMHSQPRVVRGVMLVALITLVPIVAYYLIERPFIRLGVMLTARPSAEIRVPILAAREAIG